jgi:hypothetical protein
MRRVTMVALLATVLAGTQLAVTPATANTKETQIISEDITVTVDGLCSFPVTFHFQGSFKVAFYFDSDGTLIRSIATNMGPFLLTASAHGTTLTTQMASFMTFITYNPDGSVASEANNGIIFNFILPGGGSVLLDVGRVVFDGEGTPIFVAGPHQAGFGDFAEFCEALG